jgi:hypothetical protein
MAGSFRHHEPKLRVHDRLSVQCAILQKHSLPPMKKADLEAHADRINGASWLVFANKNVRR